MRYTNVLFVILSFFLTESLSAQTDQNESPYFQIDNKKDALNFPLLSTDVGVTILGPIADVSVTQSYTNKGDTPIEAIYVFPASTRSAVYAMEMHIGDRVVKAEVKEKQEARLTYEKAKSEGKRTSLLEQHRPNVFQMNVANIMPGEVVKVVLKYTEFLLPEDQEYNFHFPTVVGPRYTGEQKAEWAAQSYSRDGTDPSSTLGSSTFQINVNIQTSVPVASIKSPSHQIISNVHGNGLEVKLADEGKGGNRDFVLAYDLSGNTIESGVLTCAVEGEQFFLCQVEPPKLSRQRVIAPREYIFIVDVSGSMSGYPLDVSKRLMRNLFGNLRPTDKFNIMFFAGSAFALSTESLLATPENVQFAMDKVSNQDGGGGTNMLAAIKSAMAIPKEATFSRSFVIVTDGYVSVEERAFTYVKEHLNDANFFAFGIGSSVNRHLIEGLAHVGRARPFIVLDLSQANAEAEKLRKYIEYPVMTDISITGNQVELHDLVPDHIPDLMAGRPIYFFGKYTGGRNATLTIEGRIGDIPYKKVLAIPSPEKENNTLAQLWARETIRELDDFNTLRNDEKKVAEITNLGLKYNLLTKYTSFVAVDHEVVNGSGTIRKAKQVLPLPQGVSNLAIGFEMEIEELTSANTYSPVKLDITIDTKDTTFKKITEVLLEGILKQSDLGFDFVKRSIFIKTDQYGNVLTHHTEADSKVIAQLLEAVHRLGLSINNLDFKIVIADKNRKS